MKSKSLKQAAIRSSLSSLILFCCAAASGSSLDGFVGVASDYVFRGISQSSEDPVFQAGLKVDMSRQWYLEGWVSEVDINDASLEFEFAGGYQGSINRDVKYQAELNYSVFTNEEGGNSDYLEAEVRIDIKQVATLTLAHSEDVYGSSETGTYFEGLVKLPLHDVFKTVAYVGHYSLDRDFGESYTVYGFDAIANVGEIEFKFSFTDTDLKNIDTADSRLFFSAKYQF